MIVGGQSYIVGAYAFAYVCLVGYALSLRARVRGQRVRSALGRGGHS